MSHSNEPSQQSQDLGYGAPVDLTVKKKSSLTLVVKFLGVFVAVAMVIGGLMSYFSKAESKPEEKKEVLDTSANGKNFKNDKEEILDSERQSTPASAPDSEVSSEPASSDDEQDKEPPAASEPAEDPQVAIRQRKGEGDVVIKVEQQGDSSSSSATTTNPVAYTTTEGETIPASSLMPADNGGLSSRLQGGIYAPSFAQQQGDLSYQLARATAIPCVTTTKIVTTFPGFTRCQVTKDVYSTNGKTLLIERGSIAIGEQTSALMQGQTRVFAQWGELRTPTGVIVKLDSLGADQLGAAGHPAKVNNHFWKRIGGAVLISMIDDVIAYGNNRRNNNSVVSGSDNETRIVTYDNTTQAVQSLASQILQNNINIPPMGYVNQGTEITIFVARDIDFSDVYENVKLRPPQAELPTQVQRVRQ